MESHNVLILRDLQGRFWFFAVSGGIAALSPHAYAPMVPPLYLRYMSVVPP